MAKEKVKVIVKHYYPPSYYRYQREHPTVTVRLTKDLKEMLDKVKGNMSYADIVRKILRNDFKEIYEKAYEEGYVEGYNDAFKDYAIWYYCVVCGKPIYVRPNSSSHKAIIEYMREHGWGHSECHEKRRRGEI